MFLWQTMEITEMDCSKQYVLAELFDNSSKVDWKMIFWSNLKLGREFFSLAFFIEKLW